MMRRRHLPPIRSSTGLIYLAWTFLLQGSQSACSAFVSVSPNGFRHCQLHPRRSVPEEIFELNGKLQELIRQRADARWKGDYSMADAFRSQMDELVTELQPQCRLLLRDLPRNEGGGSTWELVQNMEENQESEMSNRLPGPTLLHLAHVALGLAISCSYRGVVVDSSQPQLRALVEQAKLRLQDRQTIQVELQGRKAADAAFWFALAGVLDPDLFEILADISKTELERFGERSSCRVKDVLQILHRLAAAGIQNDNELQRVATTCLTTKMGQIASDALLKEEHWSFHSDACRFMIWKFSTRQTKQHIFLQSASQHWDCYSKEAVKENDPASESDKELLLSSATVSLESPTPDSWTEIFADPNRPLVLDVGCGMGVSLLGLAKLPAEGMTTPSILLDGRNWEGCNLLGVDYSALAIGYARGLASRWGLATRLYFGHGSAESWVERVLNTYPGPVLLCMIQFPTPFLLPSSPWSLPGTENNGEQMNRSRISSSEERIRRGNSQLPTSAKKGFMVTPKLLRLVHQALCRNRSRNTDSNNGRLLVQSNCEDVALWIKQVACTECGFAALQLDATELNGVEVVDSSAPALRISKRTLDWIKMGGDRATGNEWSASPLLPRQGATETEIACMLNGTPVHRCILIPQ